MPRSPAGQLGGRVPVTFRVCTGRQVVTSGADPSFVRALAGHLENGRPSLSDPAMGR